MPLRQDKCLRIARLPTDKTSRTCDLQLSACQRQPVHVLLQRDGVRVQRQLGGGEQRRAIAARVVLGLALLDEVLLREHGLHSLIFVPLLLLVLILSIFILVSFFGRGRLWLLSVFVRLSVLVLQGG